MLLTLIFQVLRTATNRTPSLAATPPHPIPGSYPTAPHPWACAVPIVCACLRAHVRVRPRDSGGCVCIEFI